MQKQKFDEIISYVNKKVSEMEIETKYKMELLGMVTALGYAHEKETHDKRTETHARDCISRQAAIDAVEKESRVDGAYGYMDTKSIVDLLNNLTAAQPERKKGSWNVIQGDIVVCSECGMCAPKSMTGCLVNRHLEPNRTNFCPNCGANMRGKQDE